MLEGLNATVNPNVRTSFPDAVATDWFVPGYTMTTGLGANLPGSPGDVASFVRSDPPDSYGNYVHDIVRTDLEVTPQLNRLRIPWIFGTEEAPDGYRDTAAILVNGVNCALIAGHEVTSNDATVVNTGQLATRYNRVTPQQYCDLPVTPPGVPVEIQLVVAESPTGELDSAIMASARAGSPATAQGSRLADWKRASWLELEQLPIAPQSAGVPGPACRWPDDPQFDLSHGMSGRALSSCTLTQRTASVDPPVSARGVAPFDRHVVDEAHRMESYGLPDQNRDVRDDVHHACHVCL